MVVILLLVDLTWAPASSVQSKEQSVALRRSTASYEIFQSHAFISDLDSSTFYHAEIRRSILSFVLVPHFSDKLIMNLFCLNVVETELFYI